MAEQRVIPKSNTYERLIYAIRYLHDRYINDSNRVARRTADLCEVIANDLELYHTIEYQSITVNGKAVLQRRHVTEWMDVDASPSESGVAAQQSISP